MDVIICLAENSYWHGVAALVNSLIKCQFKGVLFVGYRGNLPTWINDQLSLVEGKTYRINEDIQLQLIEVNTKRHLGYEKAFFIAEVLKDPAIERLFYFDTDCIPIADYQFYLNWTDHHIGVCMDECFKFIHENHPWKLVWKEKLESFGYPSIYQHPYINSGFLGLSKINFSLIDTWVNLTSRLEKEGLDTSSFNKNPLLAVQGDQEILNMALSTLPPSIISVIGPEGMGFTEPIYLMVHCTSAEKPWSKNFLWSFLKTGNRPSLREKIFLSFLNEDIMCMNKFKYSLKKINLTLTTLIARIF
ncbi:MAG: hypothetical protein IE931_12860 [Sphingobacteriales bacterium]|nr:hypothetical protein [Sphingobacteriales bacterium]